MCCSVFRFCVSVRWRVSVVGLGLWLLVPPSTFATIVLPTEFDAMVAGSTLIVHGRVTDVASQMTDGRRTIESIVTISVMESLKGESGPAVVFRVPNGQVGRYRRVTVGVPEFVEGDEVVVFLSGRGPTVPMPFGLSQGVYRVERDRSGRAVISAPGPAEERLVRGDPARRPIEIGVFTTQVRSIAERQR